LKDSILKFDTIVAACALLMSSITAAAMVYQTRVLQDQFSATVWPYLSVDTMLSTSRVTIALTNDGAGSALIRSASLDLDGKPVPGWRQVVEAVSRDVPRVKGGRMDSADASVDPSMAIRAGDSQRVLLLDTGSVPIFSAARKHEVVLHLCYCSINDRCWSLDAVPGYNSPNLPKAVAACPRPHSILAN